MNLADIKARLHALADDGTRYNPDIDGNARLIEACTDPARALRLAASRPWQTVSSIVTEVNAPRPAGSYSRPGSNFND